MKIIMRDDREFVGTPVQIVRAIKDIAFGVEHLKLAQRVEWPTRRSSRRSSSRSRARTTTNSLRRSSTR